MNTYAVIGGTLWGNRGAEAMVVTTIGRIRDRDPDASFLLMSYMPGRDRMLVHDPAVTVIDASPGGTLVHLAFAAIIWVANLVSIRLPDAMIPGSVSALRECRALFDVSGISFHDGRMAVVGYNVLCVWPALLLKVPVIRLSQAMGPFERPLNRLSARWTTRRCLHTFSRGRLTSDHMRRLNVPSGSWNQAADVAFSYREKDSLTSENEVKVAAIAALLRRLREDGTEVVAVVPSSLIRKTTGEHDDYVGLLQVIVRHLQGKGHHVLVLPNATREGVDTLRNNDIAVITELRERLASEPENGNTGGITFVDFDLNTASIRSLIELTVVVITSRFHAMIAALALGIPPLVIGWSHKYEEVLEEFGCSDNAVDFSGAEHALLPKLELLLKDRETVRLRIVEKLPGVTASSERQFEVLDRVGAH